MNTEATRKLLAWYRQNRRDLPFRRTRDPYCIWISEIMSQQTRIEAMLDHYERFMALYPTLADLARAPEDELLKVWQGLGYYSRARNLKKAAQICMETYSGKLPSSRAELLKLPGIGPYTAAAIASIAYKEKTAAIDGNVIRVASRFYWLDADWSSAKEKRRLEERLAQGFPCRDEMPEFTQALMELGAVLCLPRSAGCRECPLEDFCLGSRQPDPALLPRKKVRAPRKKEEKTVVIQAARHEGRWWIHLNRRPETGLLAGLYEFDWALPETVLFKRRLQPYRHVFTHIEWEMEGILVLSPWNETFCLLEEAQKKAAVPSALRPFYEEALEILPQLEEARLKEELEWNRKA